MNRREHRRQAKEDRGTGKRGKAASHDFIDPHYDGTRALNLRLNEAVEHQRAGRLNEAEEIYRRILAADPEHPEALGLLGVIAQATSHHEAAVELISAAIAVKPNYADAHGNLGAVFLGLQRHEEALASFDRALAIDPNHAEAHNNRGVCLRWLGQPEESITSHREAIALDPEYGEAHHNLSFALLTTGQEKEGLDEFEWRWQAPSFTFTMRNFSEPMWDGATDLKGKTLLLWPEQGPGDMIIWASRLKDIISRAGRCIVQVYPKLLPLFARSFPGAVFRTDHGPEDTGHENAASEDFDFHLPMGSLFRHLQPTPALPVDAYLLPDPERVAFWKQRLVGLGPGPYVGISWTSGIVSPERAPNYTRMDDWLPLFRQPAQFVNMQFGDCLDELAYARKKFGIDVHTFDDLDIFDDLDDLAALAKALDLVISVSTIAAPLAAGVGMRTWLAAWRQSPWHNFLLSARGPDVTRFERNTGETWDAVFAAMAGRLRDLTG